MNIICIYPAENLIQDLVSYSVKYNDKLLFLLHNPPIQISSKDFYYSTDDLIGYLYNNCVQIDHILSFSDVEILTTISKLKKHLKHTISLENYIFSVNKYKQTQNWSDMKLLAPKSQMIDDFERKPIFNYPIIMKPNSGYASIGVFKIIDKNASFERAKKQVMLLNKFVLNQNIYDIIIQEFIEGVEFSLDQIWKNGKILCSVLLKHIRRDVNSYSDEIYASENSLPNNLYKSIIEISNKAINISGDYSGASHLEFIITPSDTIYVLEASLRPGGAGLILKYIGNKTYNSDLIEEFYLTSRTCTLPEHKIKQVPNDQNIVHFQYVYSHKVIGKVKRIHGVNDILKLDEINEVIQYISEGNILLERKKTLASNFQILWNLL